VNFKELPIVENVGQLRSGTGIIKLFNSNFAKTDARLKLVDEKLILEFREIDIKKLKIFKDRFDNQVLNKIFEEIVSIKSYGINNGKRNFVDYNKERKVRHRIYKEEKRGKYFYAKDNNFSKINNNLPNNMENSIICGDSTDELKKLPNNCVDLIFTSPPYNFGLDYSNNPDDYDWKNYFDQLFSIFEEAIRVLKYGGRIIINIQPLFSDYIPSHHLISKFFMDMQMIWKGEILWEKNNYNCKYTAWGSWKSPSSPYLKYTWEFLEIFSKGDLKHTGKKKDIDITSEEFKKFVMAKWSIAPEKNMKDYNHPAMFPEKLVEQVLKLFSYKNDIILDPFNGVGTTTAVAKRMQRRYIGIDISEEYCKHARSRTNNSVPTNNLFR